MATLETLGSLERRLSFSVPAGEIDPQVAQRLRRIAQTARMPGFRPGKVPLKMIQQSYGPQTYAEVLGDAVSQKLSAAIDEHKLRVAGEPKIERQAAEQAGPEGELGFVATFEVFPEIALSDPAGLSVQRFACEVGDAEIDRTLDILRRQRRTWRAVERGAADGDQVTIDFAGTLDGVAFEGGSGSEFAFVLGEGRMLPDFEAGVRGAAAGEQRRAPVAFPADYGSAQLAGRTAEFEITVRRVEEPVLPEVDAELARALGVEDGDLARMRADVRANLEREVRTRVRARTKASVMEALPQLSSIDVPRALVASESARMAEQMREDLAKRGMDAKSMPIPPEAFAEQAEKRVRLGLIVGEIVRANGLQPKPDQIRAQIEEFAQSYENPAEVVRWYFSDKSRLADVEAMVIEQNVVDWMLGRARTDERAITFDELMNPPQPGAAQAGAADGDEASRPEDDAASPAPNGEADPRTAGAAAQPAGGSAATGQA